MRHLNRYNEEWNPFKNLTKSKQFKEHDNIVETIKVIKSPSIGAIEITKDNDTAFYISLTLAPLKVQQLKLESGRVEIKYYGYKQADESEISIIAQEVKFWMITGISEAKYFGGREKSRDFSYTDPKVGNIHVYPNVIIVDIYNRQTNFNLGHKTITYDKKTLKTDFTKFFEDNIENLVNIHTLLKKSIEERKVVVAKQKEESERKMSKVKKFIDDKDAIQECFYDIIDMSDDYKIEQSGVNSVVLNFSIRGIDVKTQEKSGSSYSKYSSVYIKFDEAHIGITDEIINVFAAIRDAKAHLLAIDDTVIMDTVFKKDKLQITLKVPID